MAIMSRSYYRIAGALVTWYAQASRELPWRRTRDPYAIWVSEIMLQQTQVRTVIPYWERWMRRLPTVHDLARARLSTVLKLWEGLGYYRRARNLHSGAKHVVARYAGRFPTRHSEVLALPGIGRYTAGAICSIAYNQPTPILDGNVIRVLARLFGVEGNPAAKPVNETLWTLAGSLVSTASGAADRPDQGSGRSRHTVEPQTTSMASANCSGLNQALMELGALICLPRSPKCGLCPVRRHCIALRTNRVALLPKAQRSGPTVSRHILTVVLQWRNRFLVRQRPSSALNGSLWEFPGVEGDRPPVKALGDLLKPLRIRWSKLRPLGVVRHAITRYRIRIESRHGQMKRTRLLPHPWNQKWLTLAELDKLPWTGAHRKILARLQAAELPPAQQGHHRARKSGFDRPSLPQR